MNQPKVVIVDRKNANINSLKNSILHVFNCDIKVTSNINEIRKSDFIILAGVGAYPDGMKDLQEKNLIEELKIQARVKEKPFLGICLGMQMLFDSSEEGGFTPGLGLIPGIVKKIDISDELRIPHVGWNDLEIKEGSKVFNREAVDKNFYFVHSYHAICKEQYIIAKTEYGIKLTAAVQNKNILGFQFHPEKSQLNGFELLGNFFNLRCW